jgi:hypothetical protein
VDVTLPPRAPRGEDGEVIDIKLRNTGGQPTVLKRLVVHTRLRQARPRIQETLAKLPELRAEFAVG